MHQTIKMVKQLPLIRYPHGGTFEIPILKVNNKLARRKEGSWQYSG